MSQERSEQQSSENDNSHASIKTFIAQNRPLVRQILQHINDDSESAQIVQEELEALKASCPPCAVACEPWPPFSIANKGGAQ